MRPWLCGYLKDIPIIIVCLIPLSLVPATSRKEQNKDAIYTAARRNTTKKTPSDTWHRNALEPKTNSTNMLNAFLLPFLSGGCQVLFQGNQRPSPSAESYTVSLLTLCGCPRTSSIPRQEKQGKKNRSPKFPRLLHREADPSPHQTAKGIWRRTRAQGWASPSPRPAAGPRTADGPESCGGRGCARAPTVGHESPAPARRCLSSPCFRSGSVAKRNLESFRLEKNSTVIEPRCQPKTAMPAKPRPEVPHPHVS